MRIEVALRTPLAFRAPSSSWDAPPAPAVIRFEGYSWVWHPPLEYSEREELTHYGAMVSTVLDDYWSDQEKARQSLQRFLSAVAFHYDQAAEDISYGAPTGSGETDPLNPHGSRTARSHLALHLAEAPAAIEVGTEELLRRALAIYREGLNSGSPFYGCVAFRNVLDAVYQVVNEKEHGKPTGHARRRDTFIDAVAPAMFAQQTLNLPQPSSWAGYLRDEVRNAVAHVHRPGRREINPDDFRERQRFMRDEWLLRTLARRCIEQHWPSGVTVMTASATSEPDL